MGKVSGYTLPFYNLDYHTLELVCCACNQSDYLFAYFYVDLFANHIEFFVSMFVWTVLFLY